MNRSPRPQPAAGADLADLATADDVTWARQTVRGINRSGMIGVTLDSPAAIDRLTRLANSAALALPPPASDARAVTEAQRREIAEAWKDCVMHEVVDRYPSGVPGFVQRVTAALSAAGLLEDSPHAR